MYLESMVGSSTNLKFQKKPLGDDGWPDPPLLLLLKVLGHNELTPKNWTENPGEIKVHRRCKISRIWRYK